MSIEHQNKIPILSFFSGGGFMDMGFEKAGFEIIWTNEFDETFAKLHSAGITSWRESRNNGKKAEIFNVKSIEDIKPKDILKEAFPEGIPVKFGIIGGPPCQDFSSAGKNEGFEGERGRLTAVFLDYILKLKPTFFVFENVKNLWNNNKHKSSLEEHLIKVKKTYFIDQKILNSIHFGVPQDRNRFFIVGIKKGRKRSQFNFSWPEPKYVDALKKTDWPDKSPFQGICSEPENIPLELCINNLMLGTADEKTIANGDEYFLPKSIKFWEIEEGNTHNRSFKRLHRYRYSPTACYGNNEVHLHPFLPRRISVREALRIQSVDDTYILPKDVDLTHKFKMIGNGVPVKLAYEVALAINKDVEKFLENKLTKRKQDDNV